jgi:amino acid adenylation domain-containing protein/thioester reductase-like protein
MSWSVHELIARQAERRPDAVAIVSAERDLSYDRLNREADELARKLTLCDVGPDCSVGVCLERGPDMIIALLAILKAGGAYLPLEPDYPPVRLQDMIARAGARVMLTHRDLERRLGMPQELRILHLDGPRHEPALRTQGAAEVAAPGLQADHLAYLMYTSGSTGRPKGVMISHGGLLNRLQWMQSAYSLCAADRVLFKTPFGFDVSVWEIFWPLMTGAALVVARPEGHRDPGYLSALIRSRGVTVAHFVPSMLQRFLEEGSVSQCHSLRHLVCSGEELSLALKERCVNLLPQVRLHNLYGPTEATIDVTAFDCGNLAPQASRVPIGQPIANTWIYILDRRQRRVPVGVVGEIYIGGAGVARGYVSQPDLTAERFIPNPFGAALGTRLYRTGDLGRWRTDGNIEYLGRNDHQVKLRGFRIELGEIEAYLSQHPSVAEVAVALRESVPGDKRLVAYLVLADRSTGAGAARSIEELRAFLAARLPEQMIPSMFVTLEAMPVTRNGKLDRGALPAPDDTSLVHRPYLQPQSPLEVALCAIWRELLRVERIGRDDNFFELGGHSLLALQVTAAIRESLGVDVPLQTLFESPTIAALAATSAFSQVRLADGVGAGASIHAIAHDGAHRYDPYPLTDMQQAYWIGRLGGFQLGDVGAYAYFELDLPDLDIGRLSQAWKRLVARHDALRTVLTEDGQQRALRDVPPYEIGCHDLRHVPDEKVQTLLAEIRERLCRTKTVVESWPPFAVEVSRLPGGKVRVHMGIDELVCDAGSIGILHGELALLYENPDVTLPALTCAFRDYVLAEQRLRGTALHERAKSYWRNTLADMPAAPPLPLRVAPESIAKPRIRSEVSVFEAAELGLLKAAAARWNLTPSVILLVVYADVLRRFSGSHRFSLNITVLERPPEKAFRRLVGNFVSMLPLVLDTSGSQTFIDRARGLQQQLWRALDHRLVSGVASMRELVQAQRIAGATVLPVVFTSTLGLTQEAADAAIGAYAFSVMQTPQVWLNLSLAEIGGALHCAWIHVEGLFPDGLLGAMSQDFSQKVLELAREPVTWQARHAPRAPVELLPAEPLVPASKTPERGPRLEHLFLEQVPCDPARAAVITPDRTVSYGELEMLSSRVAARLRSSGGLGAPIAIVMDRGWEQVVAVLGVLRAGAAYLPIDPALPDERIQDLLAAGGARIALTQSWVDGRVHWPQTLRRVVVGVQELADVTEADSPADATAANLAYLIFTSGSTGIPKGVMIDHAAAVNTILAINRMLGVSSADRIFNIASLSFDLSVYDIFGILAAGGAVVMPRSSPHPEPEHWAEMMMRERVSLWNSVPAHLELLLESGAVRSALRAVMLSGDWIPLSMPERARVAFGRATRVLAMGGATEAAIWSIYKWVEEVEPEWRSIPYGRALPGQQIYVLDQAMEQCPVWATGEIYIGGAGLALGYWRDANLTERRFPRHAATGERLYRTGDLGRYLPDGEVELLGREDNQVKISGYRVDLGEIEGALSRCEHVRQAIVIARQAQPGRVTLAAYVTLEPGSNIDADTLREWVGRKVPVYMVPRQITVLDQLPLNANGKVDRRALPAPDTRTGRSNALAPPEGSLETALARIWQEVLQTQDIGREDNFFDLGGHSLLAVQMLTKVQKSIGRTLSANDAYRYPTLRELAGRIAAGVSREELVDLAKEASLGDELPPRRLEINSTVGEERTVLLTGCTGFLGRFLLAQLLRSTRATVRCLVRAPSATHAFTRIQSVLCEWGLWRDELASRIVPLPGDVGALRLGLDDNAYRALCEDVDTIYHGASGANQLESYAVAKTLNVAAAREVLRCASTGRPKLVNHISSLGVFSHVGVQAERVVDEMTPIELEQHPVQRGYEASKWVVEKLFLLARARGIRCNIFRPGLIWADTLQGRYDEGQWPYRLLKSCLLSGYGLRDFRFPMAPTPVDHIASAVVSLSQGNPQGQGVFHLSASKQSVESVFACCNRVAATELELLETSAWLSAVQRMHQEGRSLPVVPLIDFTTRKEAPSLMRFDCTRTYRELERANIVAPTFTEELLRLAVRDMLARDGDLRRVQLHQRRKDAASAFERTTAMRVAHVVKE